MNSLKHNLLNKLVFHTFHIVVGLLKATYVVSFSSLITFKIMAHSADDYLSGSVIDFCKKINNRQDCVKVLRQLSLLGKTKTCKKCHRSMKLKTEAEHVTSDCEKWVCSRCKTSLSIRDGSVFKVILILHIYNSILTFVRSWCHLIINYMNTNFYYL